MGTYDFIQIANTTHLVPFSHFYKVDEFDCGVSEYNSFLCNDAEKYQKSGISSTQLLLDNKSGDIIGYFSLCMASIKLTSTEKLDCKLEEVPFQSLPSLKVGKLATSVDFKHKGYGSYLIQLIRGIATEISDSDVANRFIVVDADIQYNDKTFVFYLKNSFIINESTRKSGKTISMRLDFLNDELESSGSQQQVS